MSETCPKCDAPNTGASCSKCGLVFAKFDPAVLEEGATDEIRALWAEVEADWTDESKHAVFVERALIAGAGPFATSCYRRKGTDPVAQKNLGQIANRLEQMLLASPRAKPRNLNRARLVGVFLITAVIVGLTILFISTSR